MKRIILYSSTKIFARLIEVYGSFPPLQYEKLNFFLTSFVCRHVYKPVASVKVNTSTRTNDHRVALFCVN